MEGTRGGPGRQRWPRAVRTQGLAGGSSQAGEECRHIPGSKELWRIYEEGLGPKVLNLV